MLRGTDNFYFILITFSFKLELVLINSYLNIFNRGTYMTLLGMFVLNHFCCSLECMQIIALYKAGSKI